jgi:predicted permease
MVGRLAPTATLDAARAEMTRLSADLEREYPQDNTARGVNLESLDAVVFVPVRPALLALLGAVALVLLVACVNVANLLLAMGAARQREVAVRMALGAASRRLIRQLLTESVALAVVAGTLGVGLAYGALAWLVAQAPADIPRLASTTIDLGVLAVTVGVSVGAGLLFGLFPALQTRAAAPGLSLTSDGTRSATSGRDGSRLRAGLVVSELALAVILLVGAGLLMRSFWHLQQIDPGFQSQYTMKAEFQLPGTRYPINFAVWPNFQEVHRFNADLLARAAVLPGIESVAMASNHPLDPGFTNSFTVVGREAESRTFPEISVRRVTPGYFDTVGLALRAGRRLDAGDTTDGAPVLLINEAAAERFFQDADPIGHEIAFWGSNRRIVGVVGDELFHGITADRPLAVYLPLTQSPSTNGAGVLLARAAPGIDPASLGPSLARVIHEVDPALAVFGLEPLDQTLARAMGESRFTMLLLGLFAAMALGLAAVGIHGVLTYSVSARAREFGIRLALGARPEALRRRVVGHGLLLAAAGLAIGALGALLLTRVLQSLLYNVTPSDPATFGGMAALLLLVAGAASYLPARRITRIDPAVAMRE